MLYNPRRCQPITYKGDVGDASIPAGIEKEVSLV